MLPLAQGWGPACTEPVRGISKSAEGEHESAQPAVHFWYLMELDYTVFLFCFLYRVFKIFSDKERHKTLARLFLEVGQHCYRLCENENICEIPTNSLRLAANFQTELCEIKHHSAHRSQLCKISRTRQMRSKSALNQWSIFEKMNPGNLQLSVIRSCTPSRIWNVRFSSRRECWREVQGIDRSGLIADPSTVPFNIRHMLSLMSMCEELRKVASSNSSVSGCSESFSSPRNS